jgi:hypothetical protein
MRLSRPMVCVVGACVCLAAGATVALGASSSKMPAGGAVEIFVQPGQNQGQGKILFTGAVGDYGSSSPVKGSGDEKVGIATLSKGTIKIDLTAITAKVNSASPTVDNATCSASITETAAAPVISGTGLYSGIHGTLQLTESFGFIGSTYKTGSKKGQCNMSNSAPTVAEMGQVYGSGTVSF